MIVLCPSLASSDRVIGWPEDIFCKLISLWAHDQAVYYINRRQDIDQKMIMQTRMCNQVRIQVYNRLKDGPYDPLG